MGYRYQVAFSIAFENQQQRDTFADILRLRAGQKEDEGECLKDAFAQYRFHIGTAEEHCRFLDYYDSGWKSTSWHIELLNEAVDMFPKASAEMVTMGEEGESNSETFCGEERDDVDDILYDRLYPVSKIERAWE